MPIVCPVHQRLMEEYADAVTAYSRFLSAKVAASLKGEAFPFASDMARAENRKDNAKQAIFLHAEEHG